MSSRRRAKAVFIDKDGTLVVDVPHNVEPALLRFTPNAMAALRKLDAAEFAIIIITNQPGLAMGRFTASQFTHLQHALMERVRSESDVQLAGIYACPHAPDPQGEPDCLCRKPAPGLLRAAAAAHEINLARSWMVGDILNDVEAGRRAGCRTVLLDVGSETVWKRSPLREPHHRCRDLLEAAEIIVESEARGMQALLPAAAQTP